MPRSQSPEAFGLRPCPTNAAIDEIRRLVGSAAKTRRDELGWSLADVASKSGGLVNGPGLWRLEAGSGNTGVIPLAVALDLLGLRLELAREPAQPRMHEPFDRGTPVFTLWALYRSLACTILVDFKEAYDRTIYRQAGMDGHSYKRLLKGLHSPGGGSTPTLFALIRLASVLGLSVAVVDAAELLFDDPPGWPDSSPSLWFL